MPIFDGPFDLLLFFIERDELDIHNIPISQVTNDFLAYITDLENRNLDVASEFILVAATLMRIKAKALLPRKALDEFGKEIDPRLELTQKLLEYKQFKSILEDLRIKEDDMAKVFPRGNTQAEYQQLLARANTENEWESVSLFKLVQAFNRLMKQYEGKEASFIAGGEFPGGHDVPKPRIDGRIPFQPQPVMPVRRLPVHHKRSTR